MHKLFICIVCSFLISSKIFAISNATYGPVAADDTLWSIASEMKPADNDVSVQQIMIAILCKNKEAFSCCNVNALEPGKIIKLPDIDSIVYISKKQAYLEVEKQNFQWKKIGLKHKIRHKKSIKMLKHKHKKPVAEIQQPEQKIQKPSETSEISESPKQPEEISSEVIVQSDKETALINDISNHLIAVESQNNIINEQMFQLGEKINSIEQNIKQLEKQNLEEKNSFFNFFKPAKQYIGKLSVRFGQSLFTILFVFVGVFALLILALILVLSRNSKKEQHVKKEEYNIIDGAEGMESKLNLARAYIDMGEKEKAKIMLDDILLNGNSSEKTEARKLIAKICV